MGREQVQLDRVTPRQGQRAGQLQAEIALALQREHGTSDDNSPVSIPRCPGFSEAAAGMQTPPTPCAHRAVELTRPTRTLWPPSQPSAHMTDAPAKPWFVYLVRAANGALYCGISDDPQRRFAKHQSG